MKRITGKGFTLVELLVVISIISLLSSVVFASVNSARAKARDARRVAELNQIRLALGLYYDDKNAYPGDPSTYYWISDNNYPGLPGWPPCGIGGLSPYVSTNICTFKDPQGNPYAYAATSNGSYKVGANFELSDHRGTPFVYGASNISVPNYYEPK